MVFMFPATPPVANPKWHEVRYLDALALGQLLPAVGRLYSELSWEGAPGGDSVQHVRRNALLEAAASRLRGWPVAGALTRLMSDCSLALRLWARGRSPRAAALVEHGRATVLFCLLRSFCGGKGKIVLFGFHLYPSSGIRKRLLRRAIQAASVCVVWSRCVGENYSRELALPLERFVVVPYKSNHSQWPREDRPFDGAFIFAGGDSERDYPTLFRAVDGLDIPVLVSTSEPTDARSVAPPRNVILIRAVEPYFQRLMIAARLVVIPLTGGRLRGAGEGSFVNAMWHGRPVICADDVSAPEYIDSGVDGLVVPPADPGALREAIQTLWNDRPRAEEMGRAARAKVESGHTHALFCERLVKLACLLVRDGELRWPSPSE